ncbi:MAG: hypothetical protein JO092_00420, partial [Candidatus Eremiobacteraeota bacterium]|nr:hypothetical protein [Candidatus Eremiobacteraeota bacterium]
MSWTRGAMLAGVLLAESAAASSFPSLSVPNSTAPPSLDLKTDVSAWVNMPAVRMTWDVQRARPVKQIATVHAASDGSNLLLRFDVPQREAIVQTQRTNDVGQGTDDSVWVDIWPTGPIGYQYQFAATPNGTHFQSSTENAIYAPHWDSYGATHASGYTVTMRIPLRVMRGAEGSHAWNVQFVRYLRATGEEAVWSYDNAQTNPDDPARAGSVRIAAASVPRLTPRAATYVLGEAASRSVGGSTSRIGADFSYPITPTTSFFATLHPDYSNVELDQQTISPTVYPRAYAEVRPFFTQGANNFNQYYCNFCNGFTPLYTPAIPTPASGYALEGKSGTLSYTAFDAVGDQRNDLASGLVFTSADQRWTASVNDVGVNTPALHDYETVIGALYNDLKHVNIYANYGTDAGTDVVQSDRALYYDTGATWASQNFAVWGGVHRIGASFNPVDSYILQSDVSGWGLFANKIWTPA